DARSAGLTVPATYAANTPEAAALAQQTPYIIKPRNGCSGHRFQRYSRNATIPTSERQSDMLVQRQVAGEEVSSFCIARDGVVLGSVVYRGRILAGTVACCFEQVNHRAADQWTKKFVGAFGLTGFFGFDFIVDDNGTPWPLECNPRLTSGIHFMNADDLTAAVVDDGFRGKIRLSPTKMMMEGHTSLTMAYKDLLRPRKYLATLSTMARSEDVLFRLRDPAPFFLMTPMSWRILSGAVLKRRSFGQTATDDIVWTESISNDNRQEDVSIAEENDAEAHPIKTEVRKELHVAHGT
ncbi:MAG: ATP-grasp domain-containing protein, partial [Pseudomonadota bacterium]